MQGLAHVSVALHDVQVRSVVKSAGQWNLAGITLHTTETLGANNDDVFVWKLAGLFLLCGGSEREPLLSEDLVELIVRSRPAE